MILIGCLAAGLSLPHASHIWALSKADLNGSVSFLDTVDEFGYRDWIPYEPGPDASLTDKLVHQSRHAEISREVEEFDEFLDLAVASPNPMWTASALRLIEWSHISGQEVVDQTLIAKAIQAAERSSQMEPDNAFWQVSQAALQLRSSQPELSREMLREAAKRQYYNSHRQSEILSLFNWLDNRVGPIGGIGTRMVSTGVTELVPPQFSSVLVPNSEPAESQRRIDLANDLTTVGTLAYRDGPFNVMIGSTLISDAINALGNGQPLAGTTQVGVEGDPLLNFAQGPLILDLMKADSEYQDRLLANGSASSAERVNQAAHTGLNSMVTLVLVCLVFPIGVLLSTKLRESDVRLRAGLSAIPGLLLASIVNGVIDIPVGAAVLVVLAAACLLSKAELRFWLLPLLLISSILMGLVNALPITTGFGLGVGIGTIFAVVVHEEDEGIGWRSAVIRPTIIFVLAAASVAAALSWEPITPPNLLPSLAAALAFFAGTVSLTHKSWARLGSSAAVAAAGLTRRPSTGSAENVSVDVSVTASALFDVEAIICTNKARIGDCGCVIRSADDLAHLLRHFVIRVVVVSRHAVYGHLRKTFVVTHQHRPRLQHRLGCSHAESRLAARYNHRVTGRNPGRKGRLHPDHLYILPSIQTPVIWSVLR